MSNKNLTYWFTGLSGAGKTTLAIALAQHLRTLGLYELHGRWYSDRLQQRHAAQIHLGLLEAHVRIVVGIADAQVATQDELFRLAVLGAQDHVAGGGADGSVRQAAASAQ